jgi:lipopolysaccharide export LptBFGC system permease protein LptF
MSNQQLPVSKMVISGAAIAIASIVLFGLLWVGLGRMGVSQATRLSAAVCAPPAVLTIVVLWVYLSRRNLTS